MWTWLCRLLGLTPVVTPPADPPAEPALPPPVPEELIETLDVVRKSSRAQSRLALKVDAIDEGIAKGFDDLRLAMDAVASQRPGLAWDDLLDAMDLLQHAIEGLDPDRDDGVSEGLQRVLARLDRLLAQGGLARVGTRGGTVDGKLFRVVGTEPSEELATGMIVRVVRAAAVRDGQCVREGAVITARGTP